jgi:hypothetical protein
MKVRFRQLAKVAHKMNSTKPNRGDAMAQAASQRFTPWSVHVGFVMDKVALG